MTSLELEIKITQNDIITFAFFEYYRRTATRIMLVFTLFFLIFLFFSYDAEWESNYMVLIGFLVCLFYVLFIPVLIFLRARHNFLSEKKFKDPIHWKFTPEKVEVEGHGFSSQFVWSSVYKVIETKKMFLIYHNRTSANVIPKQNFQSDDLIHFRSMIRDIPGLESELFNLQYGSIDASHQLASQAQRFLNLIIDTIVILLLFGIIVLVILYLYVKLNDESNDDLITFLLWLLLPPCYWGYYFFMEYSRQQTVGKLLTRTKVISIYNDKPSSRQILYRTLSRSIPFEFVSYLITVEGIHDQLSKTRVIKILK